MSKTYVLKIYKPGTKVYRTALVPGWATLDQLHQKIHEWMEFPTFEMYGFFPNNKLLSESGLLPRRCAIAADQLPTYIWMICICARINGSYTYMISSS